MSFAEWLQRKEVETVAGQHLAIGAIFTVVSLARSYALRRVFNRMG